MTRKLRIVLIGGGLAGLAAAIALSRRGFEVHVFEQSYGVKEIGAGIAIMPNAVKALRALGLDRVIEERGCEADAVVTHDWKSGHELSRVPAKGLTAKRFGAGSYQIHRADLLDVLLSALPEGAIELGACCTALVTTARGAVVKFANGRQEEADLIVGCDGIHSAVRDSLFGRQVARFTGNMCWRAVIPVDALPPGHVPHDVTIWMGRRGHVVTYYIRGGELINVVAVHETKRWVDESWSVAGHRSEMIDAYPDVHVDLRAVLEGVQQCFKWGLFDRDPLECWTKGRVTLLGDAAHPMLPFLGQGAAMGFEDACVLARELVAAPGDIVAALAAYERERRPRTAQVQLASRAQGRINHLDSPIARLKRRLGIDRAEQRSANLLSKDWLFEYDPAALRCQEPSSIPIAWVSDADCMTERG